MRSVVNRFVFQPPPAKDRYHAESFPGDIFILQGIVCLSMPYSRPASHVLIYFHANAEDLGKIYNFTRMLRDRLKLHVIAIEYPGYGIAEGKPSTTGVNIAANKIYEFVTQKLKWPASRVILCGRSLGTGPATKLASEQEVAALLLISPYTSLKAVAKDMFGKIGSAFVSFRWNSEDAIEKVRCPVLFVHGKEDKIIFPEHTNVLYERCSHLKNRRVKHIVDGFGHNHLNWPILIDYFRHFLQRFVFLPTDEKRNLERESEGGVLSFPTPEKPQTTEKHWKRYFSLCSSSLKG